MALTITDWIRRFASQGMTYDEIVEMLGATRIHVNNALNRRLSDGEPVQTPEPPCSSCGALRYHQEPSQRKRGRRCKLCGAHYKNWAGNRPKPVVRRALKPTRAEQYERTRKHVEQWSVAQASRLEHRRTRVAKESCQTCGAWRSNQCPNWRKFALGKQRAVRCETCGAYKKLWRKVPAVEPAQVTPVLDATAVVAPAALHVPTWRGRPIGSANCTNCGAFPSEARPNWRAEIKRKQRIERCGVCCAVPSSWRQRPKLLLDTADIVPVAKSTPARVVTSSPRQRFEERAKMPVRNLSGLPSEQRDEADRWLRDYEAKKQRQAPEAVGATGCDLQLPNKPGTRYQSGWDESPCPRAELIAQAVAGDEHARWRCKQLYGRELPA